LTHHAGDGRGANVGATVDSVTPGAASGSPKKGLPSPGAGSPCASAVVGPFYNGWGRGPPSFFASCGGGAAVGAVSGGGGLFSSPITAGGGSHCSGEGTFSGTTTGYTPSVLDQMDAVANIPRERFQHKKSFPEITVFQVGFHEDNLAHLCASKIGASEEQTLNNIRAYLNPDNNGIILVGLVIKNGYFLHHGLSTANGDLPQPLYGHLIRPVGFRFMPGATIDTNLAVSNVYSSSLVI
jgi:hypothetical protein